MQLNKKRKLQKNFKLPKNAMVCGLAKIKEDGDYFEVINVGDAICESNLGVVKDLLAKNPKEYNLYEGFESIKAALENNKLHPEETFCYSQFNCYKFFPQLEFIRSKDNIINYLKRYNEINDTAHYWTFLDEEDILNLDKKVEENKKRYFKVYY